MWTVRDTDVVEAIYVFCVNLAQKWRQSAHAVKAKVLFLSSDKYFILFSVFKVSHYDILNFLRYCCLNFYISEFGDNIKFYLTLFDAVLCEWDMPSFFQEYTQIILVTSP